MNPSSSIIYPSEIELLRQQLADRDAEVAELKNNVTICVVRIEDLRRQLRRQQTNETVEFMRYGPTAIEIRMNDIKQERDQLRQQVTLLRQVRDAVLDCEGVEMRNCYEVPTEAWEAAMSLAIQSVKDEASNAEVTGLLFSPDASQRSK